ncbi:hypothetical protein Leryth_020052 [Lithospermum erythrorhizon]|nr:hypothetical protein Leryth_020052 [Lithospermum erythrorhizon]
MNKFNHISTTCRKRFDHGFVSQQLPQFFAAMKIEDVDQVTFYPAIGASAHMTGQEDSGSSSQGQ